MTYRRTTIAVGLPATFFSFVAPTDAQAAPLDGSALAWPWAVPFLGILLTIALMPSMAPMMRPGEAACASTPDRSATTRTASVLCFRRVPRLALVCILCGIRHGTILVELL